jgi:hypothetical protein
VLKTSYALPPAPLAFQNGHVLAQAAREARSQGGILQPLQNPGELLALLGWCLSVLASARACVDHRTTYAARHLMHFHGILFLTECR